IASPWLFNFAAVSEAKWVAIVMGIVILGMSMMTDYEGGAGKVISMSGHLMMDVVGGLFLAASPWIFGFAGLVFLPHLILGIMEIGAGLFTQQQSEHPQSRHIDDLKHAR